LDISGVIQPNTSRVAYYLTIFKMPSSLKLVILTLKMRNLRLTEAK
jgi:hypothetical protein